MSAASLYRLERIRRCVRDGRVILDIDYLEMPEGGLTAVVGPNGAGKSTLLKTLAFLESPDEGEIVFRGRKTDPRHYYSLRRSVTMVDQTPLLFQGTVFNNVAYGMKVRKIPRKEWEERAEESLCLVDLPDFGKRPVKGLSGGEIQRVALARALVFRPDVVLLDEPTASVDAARVEMLESLIRELNTKSGVSIVFSTHNLAQAHRLTEHVIHLSKGKIAQTGLENLYSGHMESENGRSSVRLRCGARLEVTGAASGAVRITIPASNIRIIPLSDGGQGINRFEGVITRMEIRGRKARLRLSGELSLRVEVEPEQLKNGGLTLGSRVAAVIPPEAVRILDESEKRRERHDSGR
jgi:tungstate transport system ATP-binding protein